MPEKFTIVITPPHQDHGNLTIEDAMRQVLDALELLQRSDSDSDQIVWRLLHASTNSPFTVVGVAQPCQEGIDVAYLAKRQKSQFEQNLKVLEKGEVPDAWADKRSREIAKSFIARSQNGVSRTQILLDPESKFEFTPDSVARAAMAFVEPEPPSFKTQTRYGSIEGTFLEVGHYYSKPAIRIRERLTGDDLWCFVDEERRKRISEEANFDDVWANKRIRVCGSLEYNSKNNLGGIHVDDIVHVEPRDVPIDEIRDPEFTGGLPPSAYINRRREGEVE